MNTSILRMKNHTSRTLRNSLIAAFRRLAVLVPIVAAQLFAGQSAHGAAITLNASDTGIQASFSTAGNWSNALAPASGNTYSVTGGLSMWTAQDATSYTFAGDSLTLGNGSTSGTLTIKGGTPAPTYTINNLILNNGTISQTTSYNNIMSGNMTLLAGGGTISAGGSRHLTMAMNISGSGGLTFVEPGGDGRDAARVIALNAATYTYTGPTTIVAGTFVKIAQASDVFKYSSSLTMYGNSTLNLNSATSTVNNLSGTSGSVLDNSATSGGTTLTINQATNGTFAGAITSSGAGNFLVTKTGAGTLTLSGANTFNNNLTATGGTLKLDASTGSFLSTTALLLGGGASFVYDNTNSSGAKTQTLGSVNFSAGSGAGVVQSVLGAATSATLNFGSVGAFGAGQTANFIVTGGTNGSTNTINITGASQGLINGAAFFNGADFAYVNAAGGYVRAPVYGTDSTFVNASGALVSASNNRMTAGFSNGAVTINTLKMDGSSTYSLTLTGALTLASNGILRSGGGSANILNGGGGYIQTNNANPLVLRADSAADTLNVFTPIRDNSTTSVIVSGSGTVGLYGGNIYKGATYLNGGTTVIGGEFGLGDAPTGASVYINNATLSATATFGLNNFAAGSADRNVILTNSATIGATSTNTLTVTGTVSGSGSLTKNDTGTLALGRSSNTYTGGTTVSVGTLLADTPVSGTNSSTGTGSVSVASAAILGGTGQITPGTGNSLSVANGGFIAPGDGGIGTLTLNSANTTAAVLSLASGAKFTFELNSGLQSDKIALVSGAANDIVFGGSNLINFSDLSGGSLAHGAYHLFTADVAGAYSGFGNLSIGTGLGAYTGSNLQVLGNDIVLNVVPEPSTWALLAFSLTTVIVLRRRRLHS